MGGAGRGAEPLESDRQLVRRVLAGNRKAYATLVERYQHAESPTRGYGMGTSLILVPWNAVVRYVSASATA